MSILPETGRSRQLYLTTGKGILAPLPSAREASRGHGKARERPWGETSSGDGPTSTARAPGGRGPRRPSSTLERAHRLASLPCRRWARLEAQEARSRGRARPPCNEAE